VTCKIPSWFKKEIKIPIRKVSPPSPFIRQVSNAFKILFLLLLCGIAAWRILLYREINSRFARIRAAGLPISGSELNSWRHSVPDSENGALVLTQAFALTRTFRDKRSNEVAEPKLIDRTSPWSAENRALVAEYVQMNAEALVKVAEAFRLPQFRYPADFSFGPETELPHLRKLKDLARITSLKTALASESGRSDEWPEHVIFMVSLATTLDDEPALISHLVRNAIIKYLHA